MKNKPVAKESLSEVDHKNRTYYKRTRTAVIAVLATAGTVLLGPTLYGKIFDNYFCEAEVSLPGEVVDQFTKGVDLTQPENVQQVSEEVHREIYLNSNGCPDPAVRQFIRTADGALARKVSEAHPPVQVVSPTTTPRPRSLGD